MFKNTTMLEQSLLVLIFADMVHCLIAWLFMGFHRWTMSKNPFHYVMSTLLLRFHCIQQFISTYVKTIYHLQPTQHRIFFNFNKDWGTSSELVKKAASCLLSVLCRMTSAVVRHITLKLVCFATVVPLF